MTEPPDHRLAAIPEADSALAELTDEIAEKLQAGESINPELYAALHPGRAEPIRALLPTMQELVELGQNIARERRERSISESPNPTDGSSSQP
jgi:hypothetical protein